MGMFPPLFVAVAFVVFAFVFYYDYTRGLVHIPIVLAVAGALGIAAVFWRVHSWQSMVLAAVIAAGFFSLQYFLSRGKWIGEGDIYVGILMGVVLGWPMILTGALISYIAGAVFGVALILAKKKTRKDRVPLGAFLAVGSVATLLLN